jgi:hypothetical protein
MRRKIGPLFIIITISVCSGCIENTDDTAALGKSSGRCMAMLSPVTSDTESSDIIETTCFETPAEYAEYVTNGYVQLPATATNEEADAVIQQYSQKTQSLFLIARFWDFPNQGTLLVEYFGAYACSPSVSYGVTVLPSHLDNRFDSMQRFSNCNQLHVYDGYNYSGSLSWCVPDLCNLGTFSNKASSWTARY